jgi:hypothetical protein
MIDRENRSDDRKCVITGRQRMIKNNYFSENFK